MFSIKPLNDLTDPRQRKKLFRSYNKRNAKIKAIGLQSYRDYLASPQWELIRAAVMERDDCLCRICGEHASAVHHTCYSKSVLSGRCLDGAFSICGGCHKFIEFDRRGQKLRLSEVKRRVYFLARLKLRKFVHPSKTRTERVRQIEAVLQQKLDRTFERGVGRPSPRNTAAMPGGSGVAIEPTDQR